MSAQVFLCKQILNSEFWMSKAFKATIVQPVLASRTIDRDTYLYANIIDIVSLIKDYNALLVQLSWNHIRYLQIDN